MLSFTTVGPIPLQVYKCERDFSGPNGRAADLRTEFLANQPALRPGTITLIVLPLRRCRPAPSRRDSSSDRTQGHRTIRMEQRPLLSKSHANRRSFEIRLSGSYTMNRIWASLRHRLRRARRLIRPRFSSSEDRTRRSSGSRRGTTVQPGCQRRTATSGCSSSRRSTQRRSISLSGSLKTCIPLQPIKPPTNLVQSAVGQSRDSIGGGANITDFGDQLPPLAGAWKEADSFVSHQSILEGSWPSNPTTWVVVVSPDDSSSWAMA